jgi:hypothetical protein
MPSVGAGRVAPAGRRAGGVLARTDSDTRRGRSPRRGPPRSRSWDAPPGRSPQCAAARKRHRQGGMGGPVTAGALRGIRLRQYKGKERPLLCLVVEGQSWPQWRERLPMRPMRLHSPARSALHHSAPEMGQFTITLIQLRLYRFPFPSDFDAPLNDGYSPAYCKRLGVDCIGLCLRA